MDKIEIHCKCGAFLGTNEFFSFYCQNQTENFTYGCHFVVNFERQEEVASKYLKIVEQPDTKHSGHSPHIVLCARCQARIGSASLIGPKNEPALALKAELIVFVKINRVGRQEKILFSYFAKWREVIGSFPEFEKRNYSTFYGRSNPDDRDDFIQTTFPTANTLDECILACLVEQTPRDYQVELGVYALLADSVVCLPSGLGKTLVTAMVTACMKKINPEKKVLYVYDTVPLVIQRASYLKTQCDRLRVQEFSNETRKMSKACKKADVLVFTADFLLSCLKDRKVYLQDFCLLIVDQIHLAVPGHPLEEIIQNFYLKIKDDRFKPRLLGRKYNNFNIIW
jgi:hypothetical protein